MKLFKTNPGIVIEYNHQYFLAEGENWDTFINYDDIFEKTKTLAATLPAGDKKLIEKTLAPMGTNQELWACGVTYYRSMVGRQEESKAGGGADFYSKVYEA